MVLFRGIAHMMAVVILMEGPLLSQDTNSKTPEQIEAQQKIDRIKAETELLQAETAKFKAEQDAEKARKQIEIDKVKAEKDLLDSQTAKAGAQDASEKAKRQDEIDKLKAQKDLITAATPNIQGTAKGAVSFDDKAAVTIENTAKAYEAVNDAAGTIACGITNGREPNAVYVIYAASDANAVASLGVFEAQADLINERLKAVNELKDRPDLAVPVETSEASIAPAALALAGPTITALTGLVSLFKVDNKYVPRDETIDLPAVIGAVAANMHGTQVYYPEILPSRLFEESSPVQTKLMSVSNSLDALRGTYFSRLADKARATTLSAEAERKVKEGEAAIKTKEECDRLQREIDKLGNSEADVKRKKELAASREEKLKQIPEGAILDPSMLNNQKKYLGALKSFLDANDKYVTLIEALLKAGDEYVAAMIKAEGGPASPLAALMTAERLRRLYRDHSAQAYAVQISVQKLAGSRKEHTNFFGTSLSFSGGVVASYRVFRASSGQLVASGTVPVIKPFSKVKEN